MPEVILTWGTILFSAAILDSIEKSGDGYLLNFVKALISVTLGLAMAIAAAWSWDLGERAWHNLKKKKR